MPRLTHIQELPRDRVALELDGRPWRVVPANAVARAGLWIGQELDRERARLFRRELRRAEALAVAGRTLARRDAARAELEARLEQRGVVAAVREEALDRLEELGAVDDERFAATRAAQLAERGWGDEAIRADLESRGLAEQSVGAALVGLENETVRAGRLLAGRGSSRRTLTLLARRGFDPSLVGELAGALDDAEAV